LSNNYHDDDEFLGKAYDARLIRKLLPYGRPYLKLVGAGVVFMLLAAGAELLIPLIVREVINGPFSDLGKDGLSVSEIDDAWNLLGLFCFGLLGVVVFQFVGRFLNTYLFQKLGQHVILDIRQAAYRHIQRLPLRFFDRNPVGRLVTRVTSDVEAIGEVFASGLVQLLGDAIIVIGALSIMVALSWKLGLIVVFSIPVMAGITWFFRSRARSSFREMRVKLAEVNSFLNETIQGWRITRIFGTERKMKRKFNDRATDYRNSTYRTVFNFSLFFPIVETAGTFTVAAVVAWGTFQILGGSLDFGTFFAFYLYTPMMFRPIRDMSEKYNVLQSAMASAERLFRVIDTKNTVEDPSEPKNIDLHGEIEFRNVWFAYGSTDKEEPDWVLRDVSFKVPKGSSLALVGATGSGKTTIINLLMRFYDIQKGSILLDGVDIRDMTQDHLRAAFSLVLQDVFLFAGTIDENIRLGREDITREQVKTAAQLVHANKFIENLPGEYDGAVAERGTTFSAGQRQLLAFARALACEPKVLVLDEATSNIDSETEALIQSALSKLMTDRTAVVVAHRLSTITDSDCILVLHKGEVVEQGNHAQLLAKGGRYAKLYQLQFAGNHKDAS
jgi:ABC-type multidrug transport system fused ATPase/permease subunit